MSPHPLFRWCATVAHPTVRVFTSLRLSYCFRYFLGDHPSAFLSKKVNSQVQLSRFLLPKVRGPQAVACPRTRIMGKAHVAKRYCPRSLSTSAKAIQAGVARSAQRNLHSSLTNGCCRIPCVAGSPNSEFRPACRDALFQHPSFTGGFNNVSSNLEGLVR